MKKACLAAVALCAGLQFCAVSAAAGNPEITALQERVCVCAEPRANPEYAAPESSAEKLARLEARIGELTLDLNRLVWESYLDYAEQTRTLPYIMNYPGLDYRALCDSVPQIAACDREYREASEAYTKILKSDSKYDAIHREYVALKNVDDKQRKSANREQYNLMYDRLRRKNSGYAPALKARQDALCARNIAVARLLLDYYQRQGRVMPTEPLFRNHSQTMRTLRTREARIEACENELSALRRLRREVLEQVLRKRYDVPQRPAGGDPAVPGLNP